MDTQPDTRLPSCQRVGGPGPTAGLTIRRLDAANAEDMRRWHAVYAAAHRHGLQHSTTWQLEEARAKFLGAQVGERVLAFAGWVGDEVVVTGVLELPRMDNLDTARLDVATHPDHRRRGRGTAMLEHLTALAVEHGRSTLQSDVSWDYDAPAGGAGVPGVELLTRHGFTFSLGDVKRVLDLPVGDALLDRLAADAAPRQAAYTLRDWSGPVPQDLLEEFGTLIGSLMTEAPTGDLHLEPEVYDEARIRAEEELLVASGRRKYTTVAVAPDGTLAAYSELGVPDHDPGRVYQWGTLVRRAHRGHRLGMATKVHNLRRLQAAEPDRTSVVTWNAEVNTHMIAVNEALGFRPAGRLGEFEKRL